MWKQKHRFNINNTFNLLHIGDQEYICFECSQVEKENVNIYFVNSDFIETRELMEILRKYKERINFFELPKSDEDELEINDNITLKITRDSYSRSVFAIINGCTINVKSNTKKREYANQTILYHLFTNYYQVKNEESLVLAEKLDLQRKILFWSNSLNHYKNKQFTLKANDKPNAEYERKIEEIEHELRFFKGRVDKLEYLEFTEEE